VCQLFFITNLFTVITADPRSLLLSKSEASQPPVSSRLPTIVTKIKNVEAVPSSLTQETRTKPSPPPPPPPPPPPLRSPVQPTQIKKPTISNSETPESSKQSDAVGSSSLPSPIGLRLPPTANVIRFFWHYVKVVMAIWALKSIHLLWKSDKRKLLMGCFLQTLNA